MKPIYLLNAIDTHTAGEPTRVVLSGIPKLMGHTMMGKRNYFMQHYDFLRTAIINEPRGHESMYYAVITPPTIEEAEFGQFFMCPRGYPTMCGHGTIGVVTVMIETGAISYSGSSRTVIIDTPVGIVEAKAEINDGEVKR